MTGDEIVALCRQHTLFEWSAQSKVDPIPVARAKGIYFWTPEGKRFIDFNSQLMCVNIGHGDERVIRAIQDQAAVLAYANPFMATEVRARLGAKLAELTPGDIDIFFFTNGGAEANEKAIRIARLFTGRHKIAAIIVEPVTGTNGILIPPDGYLQGLRELCNKHGILLIADEVMTGFGRTGRWFAVDHWGVVPDLITMAKGLTSSYVPLGAVGMRPHVAAYFDDHVFYGGLTYNSHP